MFGALARTTEAAGSDQATEIHPEVAPEPGDILVTKRRGSAFAGSDLDMILRAGALQDQPSGRSRESPERPHAA